MTCTVHNAKNFFEIKRPCRANIIIPIPTSLPPRSINATSLFSERARGSDVGIGIIIILALDGLFIMKKYFALLVLFPDSSSDNNP